MEQQNTESAFFSRRLFVCLKQMKPAGASAYTGDSLSQIMHSFGGKLTPGAQSAPR